MSDWPETETIWKSIPGAAPLYEIYGYWPTLHDAVIRAMNFQFADKGLEIVLDYNDSVTENEKMKDIATRMTLLWRGIHDSKLSLYDGALYGVEFGHKDNLIETRLVDYPWGMEGYILSESVEVTSVEISA